MDEILQANIFFFIASIGVIVFTILACFILYHVLKIVTSLRRIVERIEEGSEMLAEDVEHFRSYVMQGSLISQIIGFFMGRARPQRRSSRKTVDVTDDD